MFLPSKKPHRLRVLLCAAGLPVIQLGCSGGNNTAASYAPVAQNLPPTVTQQPLNRTALVGEVETLSIQATGQPQPTFQWRKDGAPLSGMNSAQLGFNSLKPSDEGVYDVVVSNVAGTVLSSPALLTVNQKPTFTVHPASVAVLAPNPAEFRVAVVGKPAPQLQWQTSNGGSWFDLANEHGQTLVVRSTASSQSGNRFRCVATSSVGSVPSDAAVLTVNADNPWSLSVVLGEGVTGSPAVSGRYPKDGSVPYGYDLQPGFRDLVVSLDGRVVASTGTLSMDGDHAISVRATPITYPVAFAAGQGGRIEGQASQVVREGQAAQPVKAVADPGFLFDQWTGPGFTATRDNPLTLTQVRQAYTLTAQFTSDPNPPGKTWTVTFAAGPGGSVSGATSQTVTTGGSTSAVTAVPSTGYTFTNWTGANGFTSTANPLTLTSVSASQALTANFTKAAPQTWTVTFAAGPGGSVSGATSQTVTTGGSTSAVTAVPSTGYTFTNWIGANGFTSTANPLTLTSVSASQALTANFTWVPTPGVDEGSEVGKTPFDIQFIDANGTRHRLSDYKGQVIFIACSEVYCNPCQNESKILQGLQDKYGSQGLVILENLSDFGTHKVTRDDMVKWAADAGFTSVPVFHDTNDLPTLYNLSGYPTNIVIGRDFKIKSRQTGYSPYTVEQAIIKGLK